MLKNKSIILGVSGSIAAYKAAYLARLLIKQGAEVNVVMTENATNFISPITFESLTGRKCLVDTFDRNFEFEIEHVSIARKADAVIIAPASANVVGKLAHGIADDMLTTTVLPCTCPLILSPAMNHYMYHNRVVQDNLNRLRDYGWDIIEPVTGLLACQDVGNGKLPPEELLLEAVLKAVAFDHNLEGKKILITAGPTREALDPVRFISNHSSGKMGYALARMAMLRGAQVTLVTGKTDTPKPYFVRTVEVESAGEMFDAVEEYYQDQDMLIMAAAVADYRPKQKAEDKIKKQSSEMVIEMERTQDILAYLGDHRKKDQVLCGFSMETQNMVENSKAKLLKKKADMIVANNLKQKGAGFAGDTNIVTLIEKDQIKELPIMSKEEAAGIILDHLAAYSV